MSELNLEKTYDPAGIEKRLYAEWEQNGYFKPNPKATEPFSIVIPPPNVTGALHMGHALDNTLQDILTRWHRMRGFSTLWVPGTDHAGIATQNVVEKKLAAEKVTRHDLGREKFVSEVWKWKEQYGNRITEQLRLLGASCDWSHERFTMDEGCSKAVREVFVSLYKEGLIYKGNRIINWCPRCHTALSDVEVDYHDQKGHLWNIKYPLANDPTKHVIVATTRPETMLGDTAVAVNPKDERYQHLIGKKVKLPLTGREIPIIADDYVDATFGTGVVKITPAHDANDYEVAKRHNLPEITVMDTSAMMNEKVPIRYRGLPRQKARELIVSDLEQEGLLSSADDYQNKVSSCYRCKTVVEPYLSDQWFVDMPKLAGPAIEAVKSGKIKFYPDRWAKVYFDWMENIREWCISRQIWWGHRIPVWYCQDCQQVICEKEDPTSCAKCGSTRLKQDEDVLDTWFSSALWPFSTMGWPDETADLIKYYPTSVLVTGYDIITFWVSRMITMGLKFRNEVPFQKVVIHGLIRDEHGKKMSKSTGNAVDPVELINQYGTDALRFTLTSMVTAGGQDLKLILNKVISSRNFMNKLWNVTRYALMKIDDGNFATEKTLADEWILSRYQQIIKSTDDALGNYFFGEAASGLYDFVWSEFCDWYVEMSKLSFHKETFLTVLQGIFQLMHPIAPFITEELWHKVGNDKTIMLSAWPKAGETNPAVEEKMSAIISMVKAVRNIRSEMNVPQGKKAELLIVAKDKHTAEVLENGKKYIQALASVGHMDIVEKLASKPRDASYAIVNNAEIYVPLANLIDIGAEIKRLDKEIAELDIAIDRVKKKLVNPSFIDKAPEDVVASEKEKEKTYLDKRRVLSEQLKALTK